MLVTYSEYASQISTSFLGNLIGQVGYEALPGRTPCSVGWNLGLNPYTNQTEAAYAYFKWLCRNDISFYMTIVDGQSPVMAPYHSHELLKLYPWMELTEKSFATCRKRIGPYRPNSLIIPQNKMESILLFGAQKYYAGGYERPGGSGCGTGGDGAFIQILWVSEAAAFYLKPRDVKGERQCREAESLFAPSFVDMILPITSTRH